MESYEVLETAIPKKESGRVAQLLSVSADYVRRWRREPESDDAPTASGQRSILDRMKDLIDVVYLINPSGAGLIVEHIAHHYDELLKTHTATIPCQRTQAAAGAALLTEAKEAIHALLVDGCTPDTLRELVELRDQATVAIKQVRRTMQEEEEINS